VLTVTALRRLKAGTRPYKRADGRGLYVLVNPNGAKWWRFKYRFLGREKLISLGTYPDTSLKQARRKCDDARRLLAEGIDPSAKRRAEKDATSQTLAAVATEWLQNVGNGSSLALGTIEQLRGRLDKYVLPYLGKYPIADIKAADVLRVLRRIETNGTHETAHRVRSLCGRVFRYAVATGRAERDVTVDLQGALIPVRTTNFSALTDPKRIGELLRSIAEYQGQPTVATALLLAPLVFVRPGELRNAEWVEFDLGAAEWRIPAGRMKMGREHLVPLARQAIEILRDLHAHTGRRRLLFPSLRSADRPISDNTLNAALRRLGYTKDHMTTHGFRTIASTRLNELGYAPDIIELQLAHQERNKVRAAYSRAERLDERRVMMQSWADYLDELRSAKGTSAPRVRRSA
jgi:integrase